MCRLGLFLGIAVVLFDQYAFAKNRLTDPLKIARECKRDVELFCKGARPGGRRMLRCLNDNAAELSPACLAALIRSYCEPISARAFLAAQAWNCRNSASASG
jgi:hypothetical protein